MAMNACIITPTTGLTSKFEHLLCIALYYLQTLDINYEMIQDAFSPSPLFSSSSLLPVFTVSLDSTFS